MSVRSPLLCTEHTVHLSRLHLLDRRCCRHLFLEINECITVVREEATLGLVGLHAGPLSWSNWDFLWRDETQENPEKNPQSETKTNNKLYPHITPLQNRTRSTMVGGERSRHCDIPAPTACFSPIYDY